MGTEYNTNPPSQDEQFDFNAWRELFEQDPEAFERQRAELIERTIAASPERYQQRLRGLMFQVEAKRATARNPLDACVKISNMMWDHFEQLRLHLNAVASPEQLSEAERKRVNKPKTSATVLRLQR